MEKWYALVEPVLDFAIVALGKKRLISRRFEVVCWTLRGRVPIRLEPCVVQTYSGKTIRTLQLQSFLTIVERS